MADRTSRRRYSATTAAHLIAEWIAGDKRIAKSKILQILYINFVLILLQSAVYWVEYVGKIILMKLTRN